MSTDRAFVGHVVGGLSLVLGGIGLIRMVGVFGFPTLVTGVGTLTVAFGVAETFGTLFKWVGRGGTKAMDAATNPLTKKRRGQQLREVLTLLLFMSGPVYLYALELQFIPHEQWLIHVVTTPPFVVGAYVVGGPLVTLLFVCGRFMIVGYCNDRLTPGTM
jgi:hypothetical protein